ncbi:DMT family transporter [Chitinophaga pendula]|uniref:EamA family transporter n=1 Tax=Chitinophaga TaxID=79328 RepID=UPI0018DF8D5C|nr:MULTISPECIES: DMT family transporter [Chitinophaga]UCJ09617.1 DMT family transporter [Chitinophaga pendula]
MFKGMILVLIGACCYGVLSTLASIAHSKGYAMGDVAGAQAFFGMLALWSLQLLPHNKQATSTAASPTTPAWKVILAGSSIGMTTYIYYQSVIYIPASLAAILLMQFSWISMLIEWILFSKRPANTQFITMAILLLGTVLASGIIGIHNGWPDIRGVAIAFLSAIVYAVYVVVNGRVGNGLPALRKSALMITGSTLGILLVGTPTFLISGLLFTPFGWQMAVVALLSTIIPPLCFAAGIPRVGVTISAMLMTVELPVAVVSAHLLLGEPISAWQWLGIVIMLGAMSAPQWLENRR